jgi:hypothetical protein
MRNSLLPCLVLHLNQSFSGFSDFITFKFYLCLQAKERIHRLIQNGVESGARLVLDGRNIVVLFGIFNVLLSFFVARTRIFCYLCCVMNICNLF